MRAEYVERARGGPGQTATVAPGRSFLPYCRRNNVPMPTVDPCRHVLDVRNVPSVVDRLDSQQHDGTLL